MTGLFAATPAGGVTSLAKCKPGVHSFGGTKARTFCGPATSRVNLPGNSAHYTQGKCKRRKKYVTVNIGTIVLGETNKRKPEYFGITVGKTPAGGKPAPKDGNYGDPTIAFVHDNVRYSLIHAEITLTHHRTQGHFTGQLSSSKITVTGDYRCS